MDTARVGAIVPDQLNYALKAVLVAERMTFTQWLITQMQRTVDEYKAMTGEQRCESQ